MRARRRARAMWALAAVLVLTACGSSTPSATPGASGPSGEETYGPSAPPPSDGGASRPPAIPEDVWNAVLADLESRTDATGDLTVRTAEAVTWNDGSLGCPEPGMVYTQALVDGYHVVVDVGGEEYDYRVGSGPAVKLCAPGSGTTPGIAETP